MPENILLLLLTVPTITGLIGWVTNWSAVKMIFSPEKFIGIGPIGWQAIMCKQGDKFARGVADMVTENIATVPELAARLDPDEIQQLFESTLDDQTAEICQAAADVIKPGAWAEMPENVQTMIVGQVKTESSKLVKEIFDKLQGVADQLLDLNDLVFKQLAGKNIQRLIRLTKKIGHAEFKFIEIYGGVFGFIIGMFQIGVWSAMQTWWLMPIFGVIVGLLTNYLAIQMIFRPQEPTKYLGIFTYQGLFAKRQKEIAADYGEVAEAEILTPEVIMQMVSEGEAGQRIAAQVMKIVSDRLDEQWKKVESMVPVEMTPEMLNQVKLVIAQKMIASAPRVQPHFESYLAEKLQVRHTVESKLAEMPKDDFERILRGIFEEDELTLILVGGVLGGAVGALQGMLVLSF